MDMGTPVKLEELRPVADPNAINGLQRSRSMRPLRPPAVNETIEQACESLA
jgi:hypothetical protein